MRTPALIESYDLPARVNAVRYLGGDFKHWKSLQYQRTVCITFPVIARYMYVSGDKAELIVEIQQWCYAWLDERLET